MQDQNQPINPSQPPVPVVPAAPSVPGQPATPLVSPAVPPAKSHKGLIFGIIGGVIGLLLLVGAALFFILILPSLQRAQKSSTTADSFVKALTTNDTKTALALADDVSANGYIASSAAKLNGYSYAQTESDFGSPKSYYLYTLTKDSTKAYARVVVVHGTNGDTYKIGEFTFSPSPLKLKAGGVTSDTTSSSTQGTTTPSNTAKCFAPNDYTKAIGFGTTNTKAYSASDPYVTKVLFLADSLEYNGPVEGEMVKSIAAIAVTNPGKDYTIRLEGFVATTAQADKDFATRRAQKVKDELIANGAATDKIEILPSSNISDRYSDPNDEFNKTWTRAVSITFVPGCPQ